MEIPPLERLKYTYSINYNTRPRRGKIVHLFVGAMDGHAAFTTSLCLDASFAMAPRALRPDLDRAKSAPGSEVKPVKPSRTSPHDVIDSLVLR